MKNKKGFTLIELLAVIVVLAIVMVLATTTILPYMSSAREDAFRLEATNVVKAAEHAIELSNLGELKKIDDDEDCSVGQYSRCFTIDRLVEYGVYESESDAYSGTIIVNQENPTKLQYTLFLKKNDEFKIIGGTHKDYKNNGIMSEDTWKAEYESCSCNN